MTARLVLVESNTTGTGRLFAAAARRRGYEPLLVAADPERYPWVAADGVAAVRAATSDAGEVVAAVLSASGGAGPAGVSSSSEYFVATAAEVARRFGCPGPDPVAVHRCRDKAAQRAVLRAAGLAVPRMSAVTSVQAAVAAADEIGYPVVCKPADGTGSRGVRRCTDDGAVRMHARTLLAPASPPISARIVRHAGGSVPRSSRGGLEAGVRPRWRKDAAARMLVEEFVGGPEVSVETFDAETVLVVDKHLGPLPAFVEYGHDVPSALGRPDREAVQRLATAAVTALGLGWGPAHTEIRLAPAGPVVIEVNPRLAGGMIPALVGLATGADLVQATVDLALGLPGPELRSDSRPRRAAAAIRFVVSPTAARVTGAGNEAAARAVPGVVDVALTARPGDLVGGTASFLDRIGWVIATGATSGAAGQAAERAAWLLRPELAGTGANILAGAS